jgi:2-polyprenyl-3-methyl-5-hydroxy-6-metoxy-1,4-benzoquinol methylase
MKPLAFLSGFSSRANSAEIMDDLMSDEQMLHRTLAQFEAVNLLCSGRDRLLNELVVGYAKKAGLASLSIVDLGAGGGDWAARCLMLCARENIHARIRCVDHDPRAVRFLRNRFANETSVDIVDADVFDHALWSEGADFLFGNHILHHLSDGEITNLLRLCGTKVRYGFFFNDLHRSGLSYFCFNVIAGLLFHKSFIRRNGLVSITRGFTRQELLDLAQQAGLFPHARVRNTGMGHLCLWK